MTNVTLSPHGKPKEDHNPGEDEFNKIIEKNISAGDERMMEERAQDGAIDDNAESEDQDQEGGPEGRAETSAPSGKAAPQTDTSGSDEQEKLADHEEQLGRGYKPDEPDHHSPSRGKGFLRLNRRQAIFGGGTAGLLATLILTFLTTGPLEFIHIAQNLTNFHFSSFEDQSDDRVMRLARYMYHKGNGRVENTRLGYFQNKWADRFESRMNKYGIRTAYTETFAFRDGYIVDSDKLANSKLEELKGKSPAEMKVYFETKYPGLVVSTTEVPGKLFIDTSTRDLSFKLGKNKLTAELLRATGMNKIAAANGARIMGKRAGVPWHPASVAKNKALTAIEKKLAIRKARITMIQQGAAADISAKNAADPADPDKSTSAQGAADSANEIAQEGAAANQEVLDGNDKAYDKVKASLQTKFATRGLLATGVLCVLKGIDEKSDVLKVSQVILPAQRMGMEMITLGNQAMTGQDIDLETLGYYKSVLNDNKSSWVEAESIQAEMGRKNTGVKPNETLKTINKQSPFHALNEGVIGTALGAACGAVGTGIQIAISIFTGGVASTVISTAATAIASAAIIDEAAHWLSGTALNPNAVGAEFGNIINFGARLAANHQTTTAGGRKLTSAESTALNLDQRLKSQEEFQSKSLAYKLFNPYDYRTVTSQIIDKQNPNIEQNITHIASSMVNFKSVFASLPKLFTPKAGAATNAQYDYGFPQYGFSAEEMNDPEVKNPYKNAEDVVTTILPANQGLVERAEKCFGVTIDPATYDITSFGTEAIDSENPNPDKQNYYTDKDNDCSDRSREWLKVRFYIFDTQSMESLSCYIGNSEDPDTTEACTAIGFDEAAQASGGDAGGGAVPTGNAQELAKKILQNNNIDLNCYSSSVPQDVQAAADGRPGTSGAPISTPILQLIVAVGEKHKVCITALESNGGGHSENSLHYSGHAIDFGNLDGQMMTGRDSGSITVIKMAYKILPNGSSIGQVQCGATPPAPKGWLPPFEDGCNHLHIQVPRDVQ